MNFNGTARRVCIAHELAGRADRTNVPCARNPEDRAEQLIDDLAEITAALREGRPVREHVATLGGNVVAWLEHFDANAAR